MRDKIRVGGVEIGSKDPDERYGNAPESHIWQAHVHEEEAEHPSKGRTEVNEHYWAEEYAQCAMKGVEATSNEFQLAEQQGERHGIGEVSDEIASAGDLAGG